MSELPEGITLKEIVEYAKIDRAIAKVAPRKKILNEKIKAAFVKVGTYIYETAIGNVIIERTEANAFDDKAAAKDFPFSTHPQYYKQVFDAAAFPADKRAKYTSKTQRLAVKTTDN